MHHLAQQVPGIPTPPRTDSVVEWIAIAFVIAVLLAILVGLPWAIRTLSSAQDRVLSVYTVESERDRAMFREEAKLERQAHAAAIEALREEHERQTTRLHDRLDAIHQAVIDRAA